MGEKQHPTRGHNRPVDRQRNASDGFRTVKCSGITVKSRRNHRQMRQEFAIEDA